MRQAGLLLALLAGCGGGGGGSVPLVEQVVNLGAVPGGNSVFDISVLNPIGGDAVVDQEPGGPAGGFVPAVGALPAGVNAGGSLTLQVVFTPPGSGLREGEIRLRFSGSGETRDITLRLKANVDAATLTLLTPTLSFANTILGEETTRSVELINHSAMTPVSVNALQGLPAEFSTMSARTMLLPGEALSIPITYAPTTRGSHDFTLNITSNATAPVKVRLTANTKVWPDEEIIDFGNVPLVNNLTDWLEVDLSPDAISLSIEAQGPLGLEGFEGPGGVVYHANQGGYYPWWMDGWSYGVLAATLPRNDRSDGQLVPGGGIYRFRFYYLYPSSGTNPGAFPVRAIIHNREGGVVDGGILDMNLFLAAGLSITNPATDTKLQAAVTHARDLLAQVGLRVGEISYHTMTNPAYDELDSIYTSAEAGEMMAQSKVAPDGRMNIFFVKTPNVDKPQGGWSPAIPGAKRGGTYASGVVVDYDDYDAATVGVIVAHEIGHYLGLQHIEGDQIDDTPVCVGAACTTEGGDGYLMDGVYFPPGFPVITTGQGNILLRHPLVARDPLAHLSALAQMAAPKVTFFDLPAGFCGTCAESE